MRYKWEEKWWEGHFESAADKFAKAVAAHADSDSGSDSDSDSEDDETARNLAACAVDANGNALVTVGTAKGRDGILYSGKKSDLDLAKDLAKDSWGNWGRAKGKLARIAAMEQEQLEKYGIQVGAANEKADESGKSARAGKDDGKRKREEKSAADEPSTPENAEEPVLTGEAYEGLPSESTKNRTWWVNAKFQWGGLVGSAREKSADVPKSAKRGFTEDDQERLFHSAHDGKVERGAKRLEFLARARGGGDDERGVLRERERHCRVGRLIDVVEHAHERRLRERRALRDRREFLRQRARQRVSRIRVGRFAPRRLGAFRERALGRLGARLRARHARRRVPPVLALRVQGEVGPERGGGAKQALLLRRERRLLHRLDVRARLPDERLLHRVVELIQRRVHEAVRARRERGHLLDGVTVRRHRTEAGASPRRASRDDRG